MVWNRLAQWLGWSNVPNRGPLTIIFYTRTGCHLCADAKELLRPYVAAGRIAVEERNVDDHPDWAVKYGDMVPVLEIDGRPRMWGRINALLLQRFFDAPSR